MYAFRCFSIDTQRAALILMINTTTQSTASFWWCSFVFHFTFFPPSEMKMKKKLWKFMTLFIGSIKGWKWQEGARTCMDGCHWLVFFYNVNVHVPWKIWIFQLVQCIEQGGKSASMTKLVNFSLYWNWIMMRKKLWHVVDQLIRDQIASPGMAQSLYCGCCY